ncbi:unnamed protein product [Lampetra fluviatilis]
MEKTENGEKMVVEDEEEMEDETKEEVEEVQVVEVVMQGKKRKRGGLARVARAITSLLRRVLLCGGMSTTQGDGEPLESSPESRLNSAESQKLKSRADPWSQLALESTRSVELKMSRADPPGRARS